MLRLWRLVFAALQNRVETIGTPLCEFLYPELLSVRTSQRDVNFPLNNQDYAVKFVALIVDDFVLAIVVLSH